MTLTIPPEKRLLIDLIEKANKRIPELFGAIQDESMTVNLERGMLWTRLKDGRTFRMSFSIEEEK